MKRVSNNDDSKINIAKIIVVIIILILIFGIIAHFRNNDVVENNQQKNMNNVINDSENIDEIYDNDNNENGDVFEENDNYLNNIKSTTKNIERNTAETKVTPGITDKKEEAIELVKKEWGEDDSVNFVFDYVNENGEYVVAVKDKNTSTVRNYFKVNLSTRNVELDN